MESVTHLSGTFLKSLVYYSVFFFCKCFIQRNLNWYYHPFTLLSQKPKSYSSLSPCPPLDLTQFISMSYQFFSNTHRVSSFYTSLCPGSIHLWPEFLQESLRTSSIFLLLPTMILILHSSFKTKNQLTSSLTALVLWSGPANFCRNSPCSTPLHMELRHTDSPQMAHIYWDRRPCINITSSENALFIFSSSHSFSVDHNFWCQFLSTFNKLSLPTGL